MQSILPPQTYVDALKCPYCDHDALMILRDKVCCQGCEREFGISGEGMLELVVASDLDAETARELEGNTYTLSQQQIEQLVHREKNAMWKNYYSRNRMKTIQHLSKYLDRVNCEKLFFLGAGTGREIEYLLSFRKLDTVLCSDLSHTALSIIPTRLADYGLKVGLFTSDLQHCPVKSKDVPIVIVNALHHTQDMHAVIESFLDNGHENVFLIEPTNNFLIRFLARRGIAQRQESCGVFPGRLELPRLRELCRKHGYRLAVRTQWSFPRDYYMKIFKNSKHFFQMGFLSLIDAISQITNIVQFGNFSIIHLTKT